MANSLYTAEAILSLLPRAKFHQCSGEILDWFDDRAQPSTSAIEAEEDRLAAEFITLEYARNRAIEYPDAGTQFEKIYDDGLAKWKTEMVDPIKTRWPKDNSGPVE